MALLTNKNAWLVRFLNNRYFYSNASLLNKHDNLLRQIIQLDNHLNKRNTSTTTSSKGQSISLANLGPPISTNDNIPSGNSKLDLSFEDSKTAFKSKSNLELLRGYLVFQLCSFNFIVENQKTLLEFSRKVLGKKMFNLLMKSTFYGHFVAGEDQAGIRNNVETMMKFGVKSILDYSAEEDLASEKSVKESVSDSSSASESLTFSTNRKLVDSSEIPFEKNTKIFMDCVDAVSDVTNATGIGAVKLTSLVKPQLLLKFSSLVTQIIQKQDKVDKDVFAWKALLNKSDSEFAKFFNELPQLNDLKSDEKITFSENELAELRNMFSRIDDIIEHAIKKQVRIFVDAEQTYFQDAIRRITIELMRNFNKNKCVILNTYQNYLTSAYDTLKEDVELSVKENFYFGAKLVRGAYMEQERERAKQMSYQDPINPTYDATTAMYEKSFLYCLDEIKKQPLGRICLMVASHNEQTVKFAVEKMQEYNIKPSDRIICFGQLLGMCDYISFYLGGVGYSVYKYVPYGPVEEVLPYLSRRATENRGIFEKVKKEKRLILNEIGRRFKSLEFSSNV